MKYYELDNILSESGGHRLIKTVPTTFTKEELCK